MGLFYRNQPFTFGETLYTNGGRYGPIESSSINAMLVSEGSVDIHWDGKQTLVSAGRVALIYNQASVEFHFPMGRRTVIQWCETGEPAGSEWVRQKLRKAPLTVEISAALKQLMDMGNDLSAENHYEVRALRDALGEALICAYLHQANLDCDEALIPPPVTRCKEFIESHFCEHIDGDKISRAAGVSSAYLDRLFKNSQGLSPIQYLWGLRAEKGAFLLRQSGLSVGEIAYQCGYKNPFHFSRQIKAKYGHSPSELRKLKKIHQPVILTGELSDQHYEDPVDKAHVPVVANA